MGAWDAMEEHDMGLLEHQVCDHTPELGSRNSSVNGHASWWPLIPVLKHAVCIGVISSMRSIRKTVFMILCRWVDDFSRMQLGRDVPKPESWAADFAQQQENAPGRSASWNQIWDDSSAGPSNEWATEFGQTGAAMVRLCEIAMDALYSIAHS